MLSAPSYVDMAVRCGYPYHEDQIKHTTPVEVLKASVIMLLGVQVGTSVKNGKDMVDQSRKCGWRVRASGERLFFMIAGTAQDIRYYARETKSLKDTPAKLYRLDAERR